jgi:ABC-type phosphate transport system substrate-binding protein
MSISTNKLNSRVMRGVLLTALIAAVSVVFGVSSASAAFTPPYTTKCTGSDITGRGASFQGTAQTALINWWQTNTSPGSTGGCGPSSPINITYQPLGSGSGRSAFGAGAANRDPVVRYIATDEGPTATQRSEMEAAQGGTGQGKLAVAPNLSGSTTIIVHFPRYCELPAGDPDLAPYARFQINNARLEDMWTGDSAHDQWGEVLPGIQAIPNNAGGKTTAQCQSDTITRVVRFDNSGTTHSFKQFLHGVDGSTGWNTTYPQTTWPNPGTVVNGGANGNGPLADKVRNTPGSIGYGDLATARANAFKKLSDNPATLDPGQYKYDTSNQLPLFPVYSWTYSFNKRLFWIPLEEANAGGPTGSGVYEEPTIDRIAIRNNRKGSNCASIDYNNVPMSGGSPDVFGDWSTTNGTLSVGDYPLCTLSYIGFWDDYADVYGNTAAEQAQARTVKDYITTMMYTGQNTLYANDYSPLPSDLRNASRAAIVNMNWDKP